MTKTQASSNAPTFHSSSTAPDDKYYKQFWDNFFTNFFWTFNPYFRDCSRDKNYKQIWINAMNFVVEANTVWQLFWIFSIPPHFLQAIQEQLWEFCTRSQKLWSIWTVAFLEHLMLNELAELFLCWRSQKDLENYEKLTGLSSFGGQNEKKWTLEHAPSSCHHFLCWSKLDSL